MLSEVAVAAVATTAATAAISKALIESETKARRKQGSRRAFVLISPLFFMQRRVLISKQFVRIA